MDRKTEKIINRIPKKKKHLISDIVEEYDGYTIFLSSGYVYIPNKEIYFEVNELDLKLISQKLSDCVYIGCNTCIARCTSRCNKKCIHFKNRI